MNDIIARFEEKFIPEPNSGCWIWTGALDTCRYARFAIAGRNHKASRVSFRVYKCEEPGRQHVLHRCDMPECVNPDHLYLGTHKQNMQDRDARHPAWHVRGEEHGLAGSKNHVSKLDEHQVREIKSLLGNVGYDRLAARFGVSKGSIQKIANGKNWGWLR